MSSPVGQGMAELITFCRWASFARLFRANQLFECYERENRVRERSLLRTCVL